MTRKFFSPVKYLSLCLIGLSAVVLPYFPSEKERTSDAITSQTIQKLQKEKDLQAIGTGGQMMNEIEMLHIAFRYFHEVSLEEGRELMVYAIDTYLDAINKNEKIRPYLKKYPFTAKNLEIEIWIKKPDFTDVPVGKICGVLLRHGRIGYQPQGTHEYKFEPLCLQESYEESLKILDKAKKNSA